MKTITILESKTNNMRNLTLLLLILTLTLKLSAQSGITWNPEMDISTNTYSNMHPRMSLDASENPLVVWGRSSDKSVLF